MAKAAPSRLAGASPCWLRAVSRPIPDLSPIGNQTNLMVFAPVLIVWRPAGGRWSWLFKPIQQLQSVKHL